MDDVVHKTTWRNDVHRPLADSQVVGSRQMFLPAVVEVAEGDEEQTSSSMRQQEDEATGC